MSEHRLTNEQSEYIGTVVSDAQWARIQQVFSEALAAQREQIAAAIDDAAKKSSVPYLPWYEAAAIAREATR